MSLQRAAACRQRALAFEKQGRREDAVHAYREATRCEPEDADSQVRLGLLLRDLGRDEEANQAYLTALALHAAHTATPPLRQAFLWTVQPAVPEAPAPGSGNIGA